LYERGEMAKAIAGVAPTCSVEDGRRGHSLWPTDIRAGRLNATRSTQTIRQGPSRRLRTSLPLGLPLQRDVDIGTLLTVLGVPDDDASP
jgi:hypothetical protein